MAYEPKIRCADAYREYINSLYQATNLDRNQIMRLMMFAAPFSGLFLSTVEGKFLKPGIAAAPSPSWTAKSDLLWLTQGGEGYELQGEDQAAITINAGRIAVAL